MTYNECKTCGAKDGRAGNLKNGECFNCWSTRETGDIVIDTNLDRSDDEIAKTMEIIQTPKSDKPAPLWLDSQEAEDHKPRSCPM